MAESTIGPQKAMRPVSLWASFRDEVRRVAPWVMSLGMSWGLGGWLLTPFLMKIGPVEGQKLRQRVADELKTTFASHYTKEISLAEALQPEIIAAYNKRLAAHPDLITAVVPLRDGVAISVKKR